MDMTIRLTKEANPLKTYFKRPSFFLASKTSSKNPKDKM